MRPVMSRLLWPLSYGPRAHPTSVVREHERDRPSRTLATDRIRESPEKRLRCAAVKVALACAAAVALVCNAARADVVDLSGGARRRSAGGSGLLFRLDFGNAFAPYGYVGGAIGYMSEGLFGIEAGAGAGFPGLQLGGSLRKLFGEGGGFLGPGVRFGGIP